MDEFPCLLTLPDPLSCRCCRGKFCILHREFSLSVIHLILYQKNDVRDPFLSGSSGLFHEVCHVPFYSRLASLPTPSALFFQAPSLPTRMFALNKPATTCILDFRLIHSRPLPGLKSESSKLSYSFLYAFVAPSIRYCLTSCSITPTNLVFKDEFLYILVFPGMCGRVFCTCCIILCTVGVRFIALIVTSGYFLRKKKVAGKAGQRKHNPTKHSQPSPFLPLPCAGGSVYGCRIRRMAAMVIIVFPPYVISCVSCSFPPGSSPSPHKALHPPLRSAASMVYPSPPSPCRRSQTVHMALRRSIVPGSYGSVLSEQ